MTDEKEGRLDRIKRHLKDNKKVYLVGAGGVVVGASMTTVVAMARYGGLPIEISQTAKNTALVIWKPEITQVALVRKACPDPIPVLDKLTGEAYSSLTRAAKVTGTNLSEISKDAQGLQERFERLPDSVFA